MRSRVVDELLLLYFVRQKSWVPRQTSDTIKSLLPSFCVSFVPSNPMRVDPSSNLVDQVARLICDSELLQRSP